MDRLQRFILAVRDRMYENPYHNWMHVFDVTRVSLPPRQAFWLSFFFVCVFALLCLLAFFFVCFASARFSCLFCARLFLVVSCC